MIIFGTQNRKLGLTDMPHHSCPYCNSRNTLAAQVNTHYFHIFWIPIFPYAKRVYSVCLHCRQFLKLPQMPPDLNAAAKQAARTLKTPWYYFAGLLLLATALLAPMMIKVIATIVTYI